MRFHFVSQKVGRLLLPYALLCLTLSAFGLPAPWRIVGAGGLGAVLRSWDCWTWSCREKFILKRITSPIRTFLVMCAASLCAVSVFFVAAAAPVEDHPSQPPRSRFRAAVLIRQLAIIAACAGSQAL